MQQMPNLQWVYCFCVARQDMASQYGEGHNISVTRLWYSTNHKHWIAGQSEHASLLRTMSFVKIDAFKKVGA